VELLQVELLYNSEICTYNAYYLYNEFDSLYKNFGSAALSEHWK